MFLQPPRTPSGGPSAVFGTEHRGLHQRGASPQVTFSALSSTRTVTIFNEHHVDTIRSTAV